MCWNSALSTKVAWKTARNAKVMLSVAQRKPPQAVQKNRETCNEHCTEKCEPANVNQKPIPKELPRVFWRASASHVYKNAAAAIPACKQALTSRRMV